MSEIRILIIDDEAAIREVVRNALRSSNYVTEEAVSGEKGLELVGSFHPHLVLLDLGLPDIGGESVLQRMRSWTQVPVIVLTVDDEEATKVRLLDAGADDYLSKPFGVAELQARVRAALRSHSLIEATPVFSSSDLVIDLNTKKVMKNGKEVRLTKTEFELLARLVRSQGRVVPLLQLLKEVWGTTNEDQCHYLRIYINQLRKKIETSPSQPAHVLTEPGVGYRLV